MKSKFTIGFVVGAAFALTVVAGALTTVKLAVIDPIEKHDEWIEENKKKANRKLVGR
ncbi:DUF3042 family protein [Lactovum miscens]|uniref:Putative phage-like protein YoqJ n=1 Tax=Lactovum miscens TaxID=190387 RepID=A0A841C6X3_9LACT|nr:DUF3042 family protein [Lactovum miscens]MBB5888037.1 putative phage-like protein YoqJ [Lactovum miscens]